MRIHGATDVKKKQHLNSVPPLRNHLDVQHPGISGSGRNRIIHIQFFVCPCSCELAQSTQSHFDIACPDLNRIIKVAVIAPVPYFDCPTVLAFVLTNANALRVVAICAKRGCTSGTDPLIAPLMPFLLLFHSLAKGFQQFF